MNAIKRWTLALLATAATGCISAEDYVESIEHLTCDIAEDPEAAREQAVQEIYERGYTLHFGRPPSRPWAPDFVSGFSSPVTREVWINGDMFYYFQTLVIWHELVHVRQFHTGLGIDKEWREARELQADRQEAIVASALQWDLQTILLDQHKNDAAMWSAIEACDE